MTTEEVLRRMEQLEKRQDKQEERMEKHDDRIDDLEKKQTRTDEQLVTVFNVLKDIADDTRWIRRTFIGALLVGAVSAGFTLIVWLIQGGAGS